jgi:Domain of unknown function (DUF397)
MTNIQNRHFRKSSRCGGTGDCVEVASDEITFRMRDSKIENSPVLEFAVEAWSDFVAGVRDGQFD